MPRHTRNKREWIVITAQGACYRQNQPRAVDALREVSSGHRDEVALAVFPAEWLVTAKEGVPFAVQVTPNPAAYQPPRTQAQIDGRESQPSGPGK